MDGDVSTPLYISAEDKLPLAENNDPDDACRFRLEATIKERDGFPILANIIFSFGKKAGKPDKYLNNLKVGGIGQAAKFRGEGVGYIYPFPFFQST